MIAPTRPKLNTRTMVIFMFSSMLYAMVLRTPTIPTWKVANGNTRVSSQPARWRNVEFQWLKIWFLMTNTEQIMHA